MRRLVVVGASLAGLRAAQAARKAGFDGDLVMIGEERHRPYTRPPLSKELLAGDHTVDRVHLPCDELGVEWRLGVPAAGLDRERRRVVLADGDEMQYDRVILATGSRPATVAGHRRRAWRRPRAAQTSTMRWRSARRSTSARGSRSWARASSGARWPRPRARKTSTSR